MFRGIYTLLTNIGYTNTKEKRGEKSFPRIHCRFIVFSNIMGVFGKNFKLFQ
jgi:hypothetical protein